MSGGPVKIPLSKALKPRPERVSRALTLELAKGGTATTVNTSAGGFSMKTQVKVAAGEPVAGKLIVLGRSFEFEGRICWTTPGPEVQAGVMVTGIEREFARYTRGFVGMPRGQAPGPQA